MKTLVTGLQNAASDCSLAGCSVAQLAWYRAEVPCNFFPFRLKEITESCWANFQTRLKFKVTYWGLIKGAFFFGFSFFLRESRELFLFCSGHKSQSCRNSKFKQIKVKKQERKHYNNDLCLPPSMSVMKDFLTFWLFKLYCSQYYSRN